MHWITNLLAGLGLFISSLFAVPTYGTTITTINGSDTLSASRTTLNNNFTALLAGKIENSSTSVAAITTLANLSTVGTVTSGTWNGSTVNVAYGGTGSTTLSANQVLLGNGTTMLKTVSGWGTSGQLLTSAGPGLAPTWSSASFDTAQNYVNTGSWTFATTTSYVLNVGKLTATTSVDLPSSVKINTVQYTYPSTQGAANTTLVNNGSGTLTSDFATAKRYNLATSSNAANNSTQTSPAVYVTAGTLSASSTIDILGHLTCSTTGSGGTCTFSVEDTNAVTYVTITISPGAGPASCSAPIAVKIVGKTISSQSTQLTGGCLLASFTDVSIFQSSAANWANAAGFRIKYVVSAASGVNGVIDGIAMTVNP